MESRTIRGAVRIAGGEPLPCELTMEREVSHVRSLYATKPDSAWSHIDSDSHRHAFAEDGSLPTLNARTEQVPCDGSCGGGCGGEGYHVTRYSCGLCGDDVEPRYVPDEQARNVGFPIEGPWSATLDKITTDSPAGIPLRRETQVRVEVGERLFDGVGYVTHLEADQAGALLSMACRLNGEPEAVLAATPR